MAASRTWVLKGSLWIQAGFLLVLTSILADTNAWIGAVLTGVGFTFVVIGIIAAHKRRIGYLYLYATLVGLWQMLALTHILIICNLVTLPTGIVDPAFIVGQKNVEYPSYPLKIIIPVLYGLQWCTWCITLVCMVSLRLETVDPTHGFEIQTPKQRHSLDPDRNNPSIFLSYIDNNGNINNNNNSQWMNQHLFNFRQSVIAPIGDTSAITGSLRHSGGASSSASSNSKSSGSGGGGVDGHSITKMNKGKEPIDNGRCRSEFDMSRIPERSWVGMERRASSDSNAIFIPNDPRISQVVVTFKNDCQDYQPDHTSRVLALASSKQQTPEATTIYITNHHYGQGSNNVKATMGESQPGSSKSAITASSNRVESRESKSEAYVLDFSESSESLSDMIFQYTQHSTTPITSQPANMPIFSRFHSSGLSSSPLLSSQLPQKRTAEGNDILEYHPYSADDSPNLARIRGTATKVSLTLSSDSSSSELSALSNISSSEGEDQLETEPLCSASTTDKTQYPEVSHSTSDGVIARLAMTSVDPLHITPKNHRQQLQGELHNAILSTKSSDNLETESPQDMSHSSLEDDDYSPQAQPNSSDSSNSLSSLSSISTQSRSDDRSERKQMYGADIKPITIISFSPGSIAQSPVLLSSIEASPASPAPPVLTPSPFNYTQVPFIPFHVNKEATSVSTKSSAIITTQEVPQTKSHRVNLPLQYWRSRVSQSPPPSPVNTPFPPHTTCNSNFPSSTPASPSPASSFTQNYITQAFSKKKKFQIPTIIIHPDEQDGEPPRILSQHDIEYLTTMPPPPLRLLIQPWNEILEEEGEELHDNGYENYDGYPHPHHQPSYQQLQQYHDQQQYQQQYQKQRQQQYQQQNEQRSESLVYVDNDLKIEEDKDYYESDQEVIGITSESDRSRYFENLHHKKGTR